MRMRFALPLLVLAAALPATARSDAPAPVTITTAEQRVTTDLGDQYDPAISGHIVVFTDFRGADSDVYYVDLATGTEHPVVVAPGNQQLTGVSGTRIVYTDYRTVDVVLFDTADNTTTNLTRADKEALGRNFNSVDPAIGGEIVAWQDSRDGNMEIYAKNVVTHEERRITDAAETDQRPSVGGTTIAWERCAAGGTCDVWTYDWATGATTRVTDTPASNERTPNVDGSRLVYQGDRSGDNDVYLYDFVTGVEQHLALAGDQANPHLSGDVVSMDDLSGGLYHVKLWHVPSGSVFALTDGAAGQYLNDLEGNRVVYTDDRNGDLDIYLTAFELHAADAAAQLAALQDAVGDLNLKRGIENSLDAKIANAQRALAAARGGDCTTACSLLGAFENEVRAQSGKAITTDDAAALVALAAEIRAVLGC